MSGNKITAEAVDAIKGGPSSDVAAVTVVQQSSQSVLLHIDFLSHRPELTASSDSELYFDFDEHEDSLDEQCCVKIGGLPWDEFIILDSCEKSSAFVAFIRLRGAVSQCECWDVLWEAPATG